jgi:hypothetical protein
MNPQSYWVKIDIFSDLQSQMQAREAAMAVAGGGKTNQLARMNVVTSRQCRENRFIS